MGTARDTEPEDDSQEVELYGPEDGGLYSSNLKDWIPLCPELSDSAVRLYWIMRALVIEKHGPVRKLSLMELCHLLPKKPVKRGEKVQPSSAGRIRILLRALTGVGLVTTPDGRRLTTSSRVKASGDALRIRINDMPPRGYAGPRNAFAVLDAVKAPAAKAAQEVSAHQAVQEAARRAERKAQAAGQKSDPPSGAGQISDPSGQISDPSGQISDPHPGADLQDHEPPFSPSAQSSRSATSVRPSVSVGSGVRASTDGGTDGGGGVIEGQKQPQPGVRGAAADAAPLNDNCAAAAEAGSAECAPVAPTPGVLLLAEIGAWSPEYLVTGQTLADQGLVVTGMLEAGWKPSVIKQVITGRPLPVPMRRTVGAIISARLREAAAGPVPSPTASWGVPAQGGSAYNPVDHSSTAVAGRTVDEAFEHRTRYECAECGRPPAAGIDLCAACAGWPACTTGCGRRVQHEGVCPVCTAAAAAGIDAAQAAEDGTCPGHDGPCGRPVVTFGWCLTCRMKAETARQQDVQEWEAARDAAVATLESSPEGQPAGAPF
ncbi:hypothetical protein ACWGA0_30790 [Streptomyces erythrochromogenes]